MASNLTDRLSRLVKTMRGQARITESNVQDMLREVRMALLEADVALPVVRDFIARVKEKALGQEVKYNAVPPDVYRSFGFPGADDLGNMFQFKADFESLFCGNRPLALSRSLNPKLQTFSQWLAANKDRIPLG